MMNRFLTRKKAKPAPVEQKVELDLSVALPSSENFRTSLIMPNLSARFSMLREQDDPSTKIGKANDDSVLHPRRQSRLGDFGFNPHGLSDIAEVASVRSSFRPPFAENGRTNSYASDQGYGTDDDSSHNGSVMSRARPGEGNVLFGGRQKIYKIAGDGLKGRTLYDDDVSMTAFQKHRAEERQREKELAQQRQEEQQSKSPPKVPSASPSISGSLKRQTSSSTATSGIDSRASTAATSINSQGPQSLPSPTSTAISTFNFNQPASASTPNLERSATKRRLYEQGLDREIQEQQSSAVTRLNSIAKGRGMTGRTTPDLWQGRPGFNATERAPFKPAVHAFRSQSPPSPPGTAPYINSRDTQPQRTTPEQISPTLTPSGTLTKEHEDGVLASAINPNDRGKATAMGVFNKPKQFNEQQFLERQLTLRKGHDTPTQRSDILRGSPKDSEELDRNEVPNFTTGSFAANRSRSASRGPGNRSRSGSTAHRLEPPPAPTAFSVFQKAAGQMKVTTENSRKDTPQAPQQNKFAFHDDSESDYEPMPSPQPPKIGRLPNGTRIPNGPAAIPPPQHEHPAFRSPKPELSSDPTPKVSLPPITSSYNAGPQASNFNLGETETDSPTLGPTGAGLSGLIRQHLRAESATSTYSTAGPTAPTADFPPALQTRNLHATAQNNSEAPTPAHSSYSHSNPWDLEDFDGAYYGEVDSQSPVSPIDSGKRKETRTSDDRPNGAPDYRRHALSKASETAGEAPWQQELRKKSHARGGSSETQHEREALDNEIAARRKAIQEKLREKAESEMRSTSPTPGKSGPFKGMLRTKSSRDSFKTRQDTNVKSKILGINGSSTNLNNIPPAMPSINDRPSYDQWREPPRSEPKPEFRSTSRSETIRPILPKEQQYSYGNSLNGSQSNTRPDTGRDSDDRTRSRANSNVNSVRSRSNSEHSNGRSRSRSGRYRDDLAQAMAEGNSTRTTMYPEPSPAIPEQYQIPHSTMDGGSQPPVPEYPLPEIPSPKGLRIHNNKLDPSTFEQKGLWPPPKPSLSPMGVPSPRPSPGFASNGGLSPALSQGQSPRPSPSIGPLSPGFMNPNGRASPMGPFASNPTPPISAASTPVMTSFPNNSTSTVASMPSLRKPGMRKQSIKKSDISEPKLISTTSVIDTVDLPSGASLSNGIDDDAPPVPPINPRRKRFGFGRNEMDMPEPPFASSNQYASHSADEKERQPRSRHRLKKSSSDGAKIGLHIRAQQQGLAMQSSPALPQHLQTSPPRRAVEGGMF